MIEDHDAVAVFVGLDVGKSFHHAVALARNGETLLDRRLINDEAEIKALIDDLKPFGRILLVVDQPSDIGAFPVAVARAIGVRVAYLPGIAMRRIADFLPGHSKSDQRDALAIAHAARTLPDALRPISEDLTSIAELRVLCSFDEDLAGQIQAASNRLRSLLTRMHPPLERVIGPRLAHPAVLDLLQTFSSPEALRAAGRDGVEARLLPRAPKIGRSLASEISAVLDDQMVVVPGTWGSSIVLRSLTEQLRTLRRQREEVTDRVAFIVERHPMYPILATMPGVGIATSARILAEVTGREFPSAAHLAAYAGLAPISRRSGTSVRGERPSERGNRALKRVLRISALTSIHHDSASRAYYDRKVQEGRHPNQAIAALARRRLDVIYAMLRDHESYRSEQLSAVASATAPIRRAHRARRPAIPEDPSLFDPTYVWLVARLREDGFFHCRGEALPTDAATFRRGLRRVAAQEGLRLAISIQGGQFIAEDPNFVVTEARKDAVAASMSAAANEVARQSRQRL